MGSLDPIEELRLELSREYEKYVATVAVVTNSSEDDAREALHTVVCRMLAGLTKRPRGNPVFAWRPYIIQSAVNELRQRSRNVARRKNTVVLFSELDQDGRRQVADLQAPQRRPDVQAQQNELAALAWRELRKLPSRQRFVIARHCKGYTFHEIADACGIDPVTARRHFNIGIHELRHRLRKAA